MNSGVLVGHFNTVLAGEGGGGGGGRRVGNLNESIFKSSEARGKLP